MTHTFSLPASSWKMDKDFHPHEAQLLRLDCSKANTKLGWVPLWHLDRTLNETIEWYKAWSCKKDMHQFSINQIETYQKESQINE